MMCLTTKEANIKTRPTHVLLIMSYNNALPDGCAVVADQQQSLKAAH